MSKISKEKLDLFYNMRNFIISYTDSCYLNNNLKFEYGFKLGFYKDLDDNNEIYDHLDESTTLGFKLGVDNRYSLESWINSNTFNTFPYMKEIFKKYE